MPRRQLDKRDEAICNGVAVILRLPAWWSYPGQTRGGVVFVCAAARAWIFEDRIIESSAAYLGYSSLRDDVASITRYIVRA